MKKTLYLIFLLFLPLTFALNTADVIQYSTFDNTYNDATANNYDFTAVGTAFVNGGGIITDSVRLNGTVEGDHLEITDNDDFSFTDGAGNDEPFSFSIWVKPDAGTPGTYQTLLDKESGGNREWGLFFSNSGGALDFYLYDGGNGRGFSTSAGVLTGSAWNHIVMTYNGDETFGGINIYVNGVNQSGSDGSFGTYTGMSNTAANFRLGSNSASSWFNGEMDEFSLWNKQLSASEVADLWNGGAGFQYPFSAEAAYEKWNETVVGGFTYTREYNLTEPFDNVSSNESAITIGATSADGFNITFNPENVERYYYVEYTFTENATTTFKRNVTYIIDKFPKWDENFGGGERGFNTTYSWTGNFTSTWPVTPAVNDSDVSWNIYNVTQTIDFFYTPSVYGQRYVNFSLSNANGSDSQVVNYEIVDAPFFTEYLTNNNVTLGSQTAASFNVTSTAAYVITTNETDVNISGDNMAFVPTRLGEYYISFTVENQAGSDTFTVQYTIQAAPVAAGACADVGASGQAVCNIMDGTGKGVGTFISALTSPLGIFVAFIGIAGAFMGLFGGINSNITRFGKMGRR